MLSTPYIAQDIPAQVCNILQEKVNTLITTQFNYVKATPVKGASYNTFVGCDLEALNLTPVIAIFKNKQIKDLTNQYEVNTNAPVQVTLRNTVFVYIIRK